MQCALQQPDAEEGRCEVKERPINMRADEVRAILAGRKTQFRRVMRTQPDFVAGYGNPGQKRTPYSGGSVNPTIIQCPYGAPGDRLLVLERWAYVPSTSYRCSDGVIQTADPSDPDMSAVYAAGWDLSPPSRWRSSVHMPRWACRIILEVASVRVQRLQEITEEDAKAEGVIETFRPAIDPMGLANNYYVEFARIWKSVNGPESWDENPFVWAVEFRRLEVPND